MSSTNEPVLMPDGSGGRAPGRRSAGSPRVTDAQLQALVAVAECGGFSAAARRLGMTQSAVSHALAALEAQLRVVLVDRAPGGARLTEIGERAVEHARAIARHRAELEDEAAATRRLRRGRLRVGSFGVSASRRLLPPLLQTFEARYPGVSVLVLEGTDDEVEEWLRAGQVDAGFVTLPNDGFDAVAVAEDRYHAVLPASHRLAGAASLPGAALAGQPFVMSIAGCERTIRAGAAPASLDVRYRIREVETMVAMVGYGMGVAAAPRLALPDVAPDGVCYVPLVEPDAPEVWTRRVALAVRRQEGRTGSPARALLRLAEAAGAAAPAWR